MHDNIEAVKKNAFPRVIRVGQTRATIYETPYRGSDGYTVAWYEGAARKRKLFADLQAAELHANAMVKSLAAGEADILRLSGEELLSYSRAKPIAAEFGISIDSMAVEYRDAKRLARGKSLIELAQFFAAHGMHDIPRKTVGEVFQEMLATKRSEGLSERYLADLQSRVGKFAEAFTGQICDVKGADIGNWLQGLKREEPKHKKNRDASKVAPVANRTRNNFRLGIQTLFAYAKSRKYLPKDWDELDALPLWKTRNEEVEIFTPDELSTLLKVADAKLIPYLVLGAFAGLRTAEIERLDWAKVNLETGYITVDAGIAKTNSRRLVPIAPNLKAWMETCQERQGPVFQLVNIGGALRRLVAATRPQDPNDSDKKLDATVQWKHNALRHSFCSYRLAQVKSAAEVALEAGNSPQMIFKHYRELVTEADANRWFGIVPNIASRQRPIY